MFSHFNLSQQLHSPAAWSSYLILTSPHSYTVQIPVKFSHFNLSPQLQNPAVSQVLPF